MPKKAIYNGTLDRKLMSKDSRYAYEAFCGAKARSKKAGLPPPEMNAREFMAWWLRNLKSFDGDVPTCGRIDHSKGYFWNNIEMQDMKENSREGAVRNNLGQIGRDKGKAVLVYDKQTGEVIQKFCTIRGAARHFGVSQRLVQFIVRGKYKNSAKISFGLCGAV